MNTTENNREIARGIVMIKSLPLTLTLFNHFIHFLLSILYF